MAWIIDVDHIADTSEEEGTNLNAKGLIGPRTATDHEVEQLKAGEGKPFQLLDDDEELYYEGRWLTDQPDDSYDEESPDGDLAPLDGFGRPNAGCTRLRYLDMTGKFIDIV